MIGRSATISAVVGSLLVAAFWTFGIGVEQASASVTSHHNAQALPARQKGAKGAVLGAQFSCLEKQSYLPDKYRLTVRKKKNNKVVYTKTVKGSYRTLGQAGYLEARVKAGSYRATTTAWCGKSTKTVKKTVKVKTLKDSQTVSPAERKKVKRGMTKSKVEKIVGGRFHDCWETNRSGSLRTCHKLSTKWDTGVFFDFENGRVQKTHEGIGDY